MCNKKVKRLISLDFEINEKLRAQSFQMRKPASKILEDLVRGI